MHDPYEDCVAVMRLYKRFRALDHQMEGTVASLATKYSNDIHVNFDICKSEQLEKMTPDELFDLSKPNYKCWCVDTRQPLQP